MKQQIDNNIRQLNADLSAIMQVLENQTSRIQQEELKETVARLNAQLTAPFTFVIVGEVKAGKSSFINALLDTDKEICKVAPSPMTDTIQQIVYGKEHAEIHINPFLKKITEPAEILKDIAIVDTPGTNTIVDHHQEITERFIPYSDLIVFVFESKNPYRQSAWEFFDYINDEWRRKIIFVLQQKDLMEPDDLKVNINGVKEYAHKKGIDKPNIFAVSAKQEIEGDKDNSGFLPLREYISDNITSGQAPFLKLANTVRTSLTISEYIDKGLKLREEQYILDEAFRNDVRETLDNQESKTKNQVRLLVENLIAGYDKITRKKEQELTAELGVFTVLKRSISSIFGSTKSLKDWLADQATHFEKELNATMKDKLQTGILDVADNIQMMGKIVDAKIKTNKTILKDSDEIFADIAERRANVLMDLQRSFQAFMNDSENFYDKSLVGESDKLAPNLAAGSGMAIIGIIISTVVNGAVFDITGGILTTVGVLFAGVTIGLNKKKILSKYKEEIDRGRDKLSEEVTEKLSTYTTRIKERINDNFIGLDEHLKNERRVLSEMKEQQIFITEALSDKQAQIDAFLDR